MGVVQSGVGLVRAEAAAARALADGGATLALSFGCAGGLVPGLAPGTIVVADRVIDASSNTATVVARAELERLLAAAKRAQLAVHEGAVVSTPRPLLSAAEKEHAARNFGALAVDMESAAIAASAKRRRIPFACVRAILDPVTCDLPEESLIDPASGNPRPLALLRYLWKRDNPVGELRKLNSLKRQAEEGLDRLFAAWHDLVQGEPKRQRKERTF